MIIKIEIVSSAFDNNLYPKGVSCFKATLSYNNINLELYHTFIAKSLNLSDLAEADNQCQNLIIKKIIDTLEFINYKINNDFINKNQNSNYQQDFNYFNYQLENNDTNEKIEQVNYKKRTLEVATEFGISIDKLSKISLKLNGISNLYELNNNQWQKIYDFIQQKIKKYESKLIEEKYNTLEKEIIKNKNDNLKKVNKNYKDQELESNLKEYQEQDNEIILDDEWQEIL